MLRRLKGLLRTFRELQWLQPATRTLADIELRFTRHEVEAKTPTNPALSGFRVFSQSDEDGIIAEIFRRIGGGETFLEIGCGNGLENNTHALVLQDWTGMWIDGDPANIEYIRAAIPQSDRLTILQRFITLDNVDDLPAVDFLSLDIDGNDLFVLQRLAIKRPKAICVEYNASFPPPISISVAYDPAHTWGHDVYYGASLQAFVDGLPDYKLVACSLAGANAFFVRKDLGEAFADYPTADLYRPLRYHLFQTHAEHRPTLKFLANHLRRPAQ